MVTKLHSLLTLKLIKLHCQIKKKKVLPLPLLRNYSRKLLLRQLQSNFQLYSWWVYSIVILYSSQYVVMNFSLSQGGWSTSLECCLLHSIRIIITYRLCSFLFLQGLVVWFLTHRAAGSAAALKLNVSWFSFSFCPQHSISFLACSSLMFFSLKFPFYLHVKWCLISAPRS